MILNTTTRSLQLLLGSDPTVECSCYSSYFDRDDTVVTLGANSVNSNATTPVVLVAAPTGTNIRHINTISVYNGDAASVIVTVRVNDNGSYFTLLKCEIPSEQTLTYESRNGWRVGAIVGGWF